MASSVSSSNSTATNGTGYSTQGTISFGGLATGINTSDTVDKLIEVESRPKVLKEAEQTRVQNQLSAWQEVNSKLLDLRTQAQNLWKASTWNTLKVNSSNENIVTATTTSAAREGSYTLEVTQLATNDQLLSSGDAYESAQSSVGTGTLTISAGNKSAEIAVTSSNNTLAGIAAAINQAKIGVTASVINDGSGYRLMVSGNATGDSNAVSLSATGFTLGTTRIQEARDASIKFGSGANAVTITSASNSVQGVIEGVTLNLKAEQVGTKVTLNLTRDATSAQAQVQSFVDAYNASTKFISEQFAYDAQKKQGGILMGDASLVSIDNRLKSLLVSAVGTGGTYSSLRTLGLSLEDDGTLSFDTEKFQTAVSTDAESVQALFRTSGRSDNGKISFVYAGVNAKEPSSAGYSVRITKAAERATLLGTQVTEPVEIDGTNDSVTLSLDGGGAITVQLTQGSYTADQLAAEIAARVNAAAKTGSQLLATVENGQIRLSSARYGSASRVSLVSGTGLSALGFAGGESDTGVDVEGTINGDSAVGNGQTLSGAKGARSTDGVTLTVSLSTGDLEDAGGVVTTAVHFAKGIGNRLDEYLQGLTTPVIGSIGMKESALNDSISSLQKTIDDMQTRLDAKRSSLLEQFNKMEEAISNLNGQSSYLTSALSSLARG